jgi:hypothetical protein
MQPSARQRPGTGQDAVTIPQLLNYQGKLTDAGGNPLNITTDMTFRIYDGLTQVWTETQTGVQVVEGIFNVLLGSVSAISSLPEAGNCSLEVTIGAEPIVPKIPFVSVPYTYYADKADDADNLGGAAASTYMQNGDAAGGQLAATYPSPSIAQMGATGGQVLKWNGSAWAPAADAAGDTNYWTDNGTYFSAKQNSGVQVYDAGQTYGVYGTGYLRGV